MTKITVDKALIEPAAEPSIDRDTLTVNLMRVAGLDKHTARKCADVVGFMLAAPPPPAEHSCKWPTCQTEKYQQDLADQLVRELIGEPRKGVKLTHHQITECHPVLYGLDDDALAFARAIEAAFIANNNLGNLMDEEGN